MIDLHTHTVLSDGELLPFELVRRAVAIGYRAIAVTDHVDASNIDLVVPRIAKALKRLKSSIPIEAIPGAEITHAPPALIGELVKEARELGAAIVVVHGETLAEPVLEGTNLAAIEAGADILAHPGLITDDEARLARERSVVLEITSRKGHSISNGHVAKTAIRHGVRMTIDTDSHSPSDLITRERAISILMGAGLDAEQIPVVFDNARQLTETALRRMK
ncbi:MAG: histidinol phosphate phosphatase domain-containing protein [Nitrospiraceae bacterium]|nr:histidinol phosphate phosphatase domain-containing protein [Nitrospiraceae bacterium]